jgi:CheY-like chemotaxis protein
MHGGQVSAESDGIDRGATFTVRLPVRAVRVAGVPPQPQSKAGSLHDLRVLVIDDDEDARQLVAHVLTTHGARVAVAASDAEAADAVRTLHPDVVVTDLGFGEQDGIALIATLQIESGLRAPVIALTAFSTEEHRERAFRSGFAQYLVKPADAERLVSAVARAGRRAV